MITLTCGSLDTAGEASSLLPSSAVNAAAGEVRLWYHTFELPDGTLTPGWFDLRAVVDRLPWPPVAGRRCLDVATYDGFYAFELERRGAAEVVATDVGRHQDWDWPARLRGRGGAELERLAGAKGQGFEVAREALGSAVAKRTVNVYDLSPERLGVFDVVVCGSLLLHLRDPVRALEAIRSVCAGWFMSVEAVSLPLSLLLPRRPAAELARLDETCQWWTVNSAGHRRLLEAAGFEVERSVGLFAEPFGPGHPARSQHAGVRRAVARLARRALLGGDGVPHAALLARPAPVP
jgi:tRNA (mo5U34)-methyltransferase